MYAASLTPYTHAAWQSACVSTTVRRDGSGVTVGFLLLYYPVVFLTADFGGEIVRFEV